MRESLWASEGLFEKTYRVPLWNGSDYVSILHDICERERIDLGIVTPEPEVLAWSESIDVVPALLPPPKLGRIVLSKRILVETIANSGRVPSYSIYTR